MNKEKYDDSLIYIILLSSFTILFSTLCHYKFNILNTTILSSFLLLPVIFYVQNIIFNKYSLKISILSIIISIISTIIFNIIMNFSIGKELLINVLSINTIILLITSFINLIMFSFIKYETKETYILVFISYLLIQIIYNLIYVIFNIDRIVLKDYYKEYLLVILIEFLIVVIISIIDKKTIRKQKIISRN